MFFPKILKTFFLERPFTHLYLANTKSVIVAYLDNYKGKEVPFGDVETRIPPKLKYFATIQYDNRVLLTGGLNSQLENPEDVYSEIFDYCHEMSFELNVKLGTCTTVSKMKEKRARHCLTMMPSGDHFNKHIIAVGGVQIRYNRDPYKKRTKMIYFDLANIEYYSLATQTWEKFNARLQIARHDASVSYVSDYLYVIGGHTVD